MRVKRYVVESMPEALQRIRSDLGKDAVILNTKEIRSGGFLGLFGKKRIEVIAATDAGEGRSNPSGLTREAGADFSQMSVLKRSANASAVVNASGSRTAIADPVRMPASAVSAPERLEAAPPAVATLEDPIMPPPLVPGSRMTSKRVEDMLLEEIKQMREMMVRMSAGAKSQSAYPEAIHAFERRLLEHEIAPELVERILLAAAEEYGGESSPKTDDAAYRAVQNQLHQLLKAPYPKGLANDTRIAHFVGPTGVGKTTTIAKLAAEQVLKHKRKVGFITSDTYRIAAIEQLKTYATILNVPLEVVFSPQELTRAFQQLQDRDIIFMDTAGRNFQNQMYVSELNSLLQSNGKSETYLVLGLTSKYRDMKAITDNFANFKLDKVLFTKLDETSTYGSIVNLLHDFPIRISYVTNGQNVPDDIAELDEERLVKLLLEEREQ